MAFEDSVIWRLLFLKLCWQALIAPTSMKHFLIRMGIFPPVNVWQDECCHLPRMYHTGNQLYVLDELTFWNTTHRNRHSWEKVHALPYYYYHFIIVFYYRGWVSTVWINWLDVLPLTITPFPVSFFAQAHRPHWYFIYSWNPRWLSWMPRSPSNWGCEQLLKKQLFPDHLFPWNSNRKVQRTPLHLTSL